MINRAIHKHIIHCSDTPNNRDVTVDEIRDWHVNGNGWNDIGYHFVIYRDGSLHVGRPLELSGAHCAGENHDSIGTCLIGRDKFTKKQFDTLANLEISLRAMIPEMRTTLGHTNYNPGKTCPNFNVSTFLEERGL